MKIVVINVKRRTVAFVSLAALAISLLSIDRYISIKPVTMSRYDSVSS